ncbi:MAG: 50S ribosomal protein L6 [Candidatus Methanomethylicia archaeon]
MSKTYLARNEINVPDDVEVSIEDMKIKISGPKGILEREFSHIRNIKIRMENGRIIIESYFPSKRDKALVGTLTGHIKNMIKGVREGFKYKLKVAYSHFPISVKVKGNYVYIENFMGEKFPRKAKIIGKVDVKVDGDDIVIEGLDVEDVSHTAANIEHATKIVGRDPRVFLDGIYVYARE